MYLSRFRQLINYLLPVLLLLGMMMAPATEARTTTYQPNLSTEVNRSLAEISRAERAGDLNLLYDLMLPDARMLISRMAFVNWWPTVAQTAPTNAIKIGELDFRDITYELTDAEFENVAFASYSYNDTAGKTVERTAQLAEVGGVWRWMPDIASDDLAKINSYAGYTVNFTSHFSTETYRDLDTYWAQIFSDWDTPYRAPTDMIGVREVPTRTGCGPIDDLDELFAQYCGLDETIYFNPDMRDVIVDRFGQAAWDMIIAHEWGHHIQNISGVYVTKAPEIHGGNYSIEHELQADCLSATFMQDGTVRGIVSLNDIDELEQMISYFGDPTDTSWDDILAHGTADQRRQSFLSGFDDGLRGCHLSASN